MSGAATVAIYKTIYLAVIRFFYTADYTCDVYNNHVLSVYNTYFYRIELYPV